MKHIGGGPYEQSFDPDGPQADCWVYEDLVYIHKRHVAAVGFDRDDMTMSPITYDEMRPGCYEPEGAHRRHGDEPRRGVALLPDVPALLRPDVPRGQGPRPRARPACYAYNDWMVEEWCGDSGGRLLPLPIIPLWDAELAAAEVRRNADARRAGGVLQRDPAAPRAPVDPLRRVGSVLRRVRGDRDGDLHAHRLVVADAGDVGRCAGGGGGHAQLRQRDGVDERLPLLGDARAVPGR